MKVLVTGAGGFIGQHALVHLARTGEFEIIAISRNRSCTDAAGVRWLKADIMHHERVRDVIVRERPSHLLHLAWDTAPGAFWAKQENLDWVAASIVLQQAFREAGGIRMVAAGSCAEYDWRGEGTLFEDQTPLRPATLYGKSKSALGELLMSGAAAAGLQAAWGRIFWLYGPGEKRGRLVSDVAANLSEGVPVECSDGSQIRDFMHVADVAAAFVAALRSDWCGPFNIGSGDGTSVRGVIDRIARRAGRTDLLRFGARATSPDDAPRLVADISVLRDRIGFKPRWSLDAGLADTLDWWVARA